MDLELYFDKIAQYAEGLLPEAERAAFEAELAENAELRQALQIYRISNEAIEQGVENKLRGQLESWASEDNESFLKPDEQPNAMVVTKRPNWIRLAAAACVVLLAGWFLLQWMGRGYTNEALFSANYELPEPGVFRSGSNVENPLEPGFKALENKDFLGASNFFLKIPDDQERYVEAQYYLGHARLNLHQYDDALAAFTNVIRSGDPRFKEKAEWNLVLTYVAAHSDESLIREFLNPIANNPAHAYHKQAVELENKLGSFLRK